MPIGTINKTTVQGIKRDLQQGIETYPVIYPEHVQQVDATTKIESYAFTGAVPVPREMIDGRRIRSIRAFSYDIKNKTQELSVLFPREWFEDDQVNSVKTLIGDLIEAWGTYKDLLFTAMLEAGGAAGSLAYDGQVFFNDTRVVGSSGTIDNNSTSLAAADDAVPTSAEWLSAMNDIMSLMYLYKDDQGRPTNVGAMNGLRVIMPVQMNKNVREALEATEIASTSNVFGRNLAEFDLNPYLTPSATTKTMYVHAVGAGGASRKKAFLYQQRLPLEILIYDDAKWVDANDGLLVTCRERFVFAYGEPVRVVRHIFTT